MKLIVSAKPGQPVIFYGKQISFPVTQTEDEFEAVSVISSILNVAYKHAVINNRQLLQAMIGNRCRNYKDKELSQVISNVKKNNPLLANKIIQNFKV